MRHGGPHFAPPDDIAVVGARGLGREAGGVQAGVRLGDAEAHLVLTRDKPWNQLLFLFGRSKFDQRHRAKDVEVERARAGEAGPALGHGLHGDGGLGDAKSGTAQLHRHRRAQPAGLGHGADKRFRKFPGIISAPPVVGVETGAELQDAVSDRLLLVGKPEAVHPVAPYPNLRGSSRSANGPGSAPMV